MQHELPSASADDQRTADTDTMLSRRRFCNRMVGLIAGSTCIGAVSVQGSRAQPTGSEIVGRQEEPRVMPDSATPYFAYVGSRTTRERNARGDGLSVYRVDPKAAAWTPVQVLDDLVNPSFLSFDRQRRFLYAVHGDGSEISAFRIDPKSGELTILNRESTGGKNPVHLCVDPTNRFAVVVNHVTSSLAVLPIKENGALGRMSDLVTLTGKIGPHRVEQPFSKPHQAQYDPTDRFIAVPDKGLDRTFIFRLDAETGKLSAVEGAVAEAREGAGPRHIAFHPSNRFAYVINELDSTVMACRFDAGTGGLAPFQVLTALPDSFVGNSRAAEIAVSATSRFVYASNRGYDSIAVFAVDGLTGRLAATGWHLTGGRTPRFFAPSPVEDLLFVANEDSDDIVGFGVDPHTGSLASVGTVARTGSPVCILFNPAGEEQTAR
ncbi:6-phosphogluconolactonase [Skermanella aerolata]|uniref:6-phosphogluconolactonase n=1 Tax=Skermanella aerolata TaxID=393310 RepID=A0A512E3Z7_9PROT|nr:lactonase family protein [Skermanella aerolata]KJB91269.1 hemagglutinin [Skermanella aerolata KACC 11604]GEO43453.1 6-phosphogluconolactonase [Skermanella aerolata]